MLSYMLPPVEEKPQSPRNLSLNLNLQNTTQSSHSSSDIDPHEHEDVIDENTKLLTIERQDYVPARLNGNGNLIKNGGNKINYNMNITNNNLCNNNLINTNHNNNSIIKNGNSTYKDDGETDSATTNENSVNNNEEMNSTGDKKIIKMTKLGSKNVTLKRWVTQLFLINTKTESLHARKNFIELSWCL